MRSQKWHFWIFFLAGILYCNYSAVAQSTPRSLLWEPEFDVTFPAQNEWSFSLGMANRYLFQTSLEGEQVAANDQQHFELNQFSHYKIGDRATLSLGFRYRFREAFKDSRHDEFRIIQQFGYKLRGVLFTPAHRLRFEQRFRDLTIYRLRYRIGVSQALSEEFGLGLSTEFLYSMVKDLRPETDQRFTIKLENSSFKNLDLSAGVELRREDYTGAPSSEFYILSGASLKL